MTLSIYAQMSGFFSAMHFGIQPLRLLKIAFCESPGSTPTQSIQTASTDVYPLTYAGWQTNEVNLRALTRSFSDSA